MNKEYRKRYYHANIEQERRARKASAKRRYKKDPSRANLIAKTWRKNHPMTPDQKAKAKEYQKEYRKNNKERLREMNKTWRRTHKERDSQMNKAERLRLKMDVFRHYSPDGIIKCLHCSFTDIRALVLDHINDDGASERERYTKAGARYGGGTTFYRFLRKNNYPSLLQILCQNCSWIKEMNRRSETKSLNNQLD